MSHSEFQCETEELVQPTLLLVMGGETNSTEDQEPNNIKEALLGDVKITK